MLEYQSYFILKFEVNFAWKFDHIERRMQIDVTPILLLLLNRVCPDQGCFFVFI
jgi:hypothetical protein